MKFDTDLLQLCDDVEFNIQNFGEEAEPLIQVDRFIRGVNQLRDLAVQVNRFEPSDSFYPGIRMPVPLIYTAALAKNLSPLIEKYFGFYPRNVKKASSRFSIVTTPPSALSLMQQIPHFDAPSKNSLAAIHYLNDGAFGGTAFYRHLKTGYEYIDRQRYDHYMACIKAEFTSEAHQASYIVGDTNEFKKITQVDSKFNRLLMYRGSSLHSGLITPSYNFDPSPATGRLTVTTFIEFD